MSETAREREQRWLCERADAEDKCESVAAGAIPYKDQWPTMEALIALLKRNCAYRCVVSDRVSIELRDKGYVVYIDGYAGMNIAYFSDLFAAIKSALRQAEGAK